MILNNPVLCSKNPSVNLSITGASEPGGKTE